MILFTLIAELVLLYFLSRSVTKSLYTLFLLLFRARSVAIGLLLVLQFPGTVIHELAHLFTAEILRVPTGKLTLVPESIRDSEIRSGSVSIAETDPFRRYTIGLAPIFAGLLTLTATSYFLPQTSGWIYWSLCYLVFAISNSMFSSPEDLKGFMPFAIALGLFIAAGFFLGLRITLTGQVLEITLRTLGTLTNSLTVVLTINIGLLLFSWGMTQFFLRVFRLRLHPRNG